MELFITPNIIRATIHIDLLLKLLSDSMPSVDKTLSVEWSIRSCKWLSNKWYIIQNRVLTKNSLDNHCDSSKTGRFSCWYCILGPYNQIKISANRMVTSEKNKTKKNKTKQKNNNDKTGCMRKKYCSLWLFIESSHCCDKCTWHTLISKSNTYRKPLSRTAGLSTKRTVYLSLIGNLLYLQNH